MTGKGISCNRCGACGEAEETFAVAVIVTLGKCHTGTKLLTAPSLSPQLGQRQPPPLPANPVPCCRIDPGSPSFSQFPLAPHVSLDQSSHRTWSPSHTLQTTRSILLKQIGHSPPGSPASSRVKAPWALSPPRPHLDHLARSSLCLCTCRCFPRGVHALAHHLTPVPVRHHTPVPVRPLARPPRPLPSHRPLSFPMVTQRPACIQQTLWQASPLSLSPSGACPLEGGDLWRVGTMDLAYVCEWEKWPKSTHCPSVPLACAWSCRNLIAFTTDLRNDDQGASPRPRPSPLLTQAPTVPGALQWGNSRVSRPAWEAPPSCLGPLGACSFVTGVVRTPAPQGCKGRTCSTDGCCPLRASRLTAGS